MKHGRILMFADGNFLAHISRVLEIGKVLRDTFGRDVLFAASGRFTRLIEEAGFAVRPCFTVPGEQTLALARRATLVDPVWWYRTVSASIRSDIEAIRRERPAVVVGDMHWSLKAAAIECGVPYASVVNAAWTKYFSHALQAFDNHALTSALGPTLATRLLPAFKQAALWYWALPYKLWKLTGRFDARTTTLADVMEGDVTLLADIPEFCPVRNLPARARYIGPVLWNPPFDPPQWISRLDPARPTIYFSMGSTGDDTLLDVAWQAFAGSDYQVLITKGGLVWRPPSPAANMFITDFAPGMALLDRADVCVNHGGNGTIYQALSAAVPVVGIGGHIDQQVQLQLCEAAGVGRRVGGSRLKPKALRDAVDEVVRDPAYKRNAALLKNALAGYDGPQLAAQAIAALS